MHLLLLSAHSSSYMLMYYNSMHSNTNWLVKIPIDQDFISNIRYDQPTDSYVLIHEQSMLNLVAGVDKLSQIYTLGQAKNVTMHFQTNIYDAFRMNDRLLVSNRSMPVRVYTFSEDMSFTWGTFNDKKSNSQEYLSPLQFARHENVIIGGGKKFLSQYDCTKLCVASKVKEMNKRFVSAVELLNDYFLVAGQFDGTLTFLDLRAEESGQSIKTHVDLVTRIKRVPHREYQVISLARKDNFTYLWDCRKLDSFVNCYEQPLYGNQRTGLDVSHDGKILWLGDQNGNIIGKSIETAQTVLTHFTSINRCVSSLYEIGSGVAYAVGEREFPFQKGESRSGFIGFLCTN